VQIKKRVLQALIASAAAIGSAEHFSTPIQACSRCEYLGAFPGGLWSSVCVSGSPGYGACKAGGTLQDCTVYNGQC